MNNCKLLSLVCMGLYIVSAWSLNPGYAQQLSAHLRVDTDRGLNAASIEVEGKRLCVYGATGQNAELILLTHHRRDALARAVDACRAGTRCVAPEAEREWLERPQEFWSRFAKERFHDYACQSTRVLPSAIPVSQWARGGQKISWQNLEFEVLDTPGYTPGAISYVTTLDNRRIGFTGDLIYGDGQLVDLTSFQDAIEVANIRGYHGYAGRLAALMSSLDALAAMRCDVLVPLRGPIIEQPQKSIEQLQQRVRAVYHNYLSTNALHWYFKEERMRQCGQRVLGEQAKVELMPYAHHEKAPDWVFENATSRMIISDDGAGFLIDCGYDRVIEAVQKVIDSGLIKRVEGIFVTHYHDDHTDRVQAASEKFNCPVYALEEYADILRNPAAYRMPAMTDVPIKNLQSLSDGYRMRWREYELTFRFFPGQAIYHGALLVQRGQEKPIFFVGDSFAPSGIDDYCLQNRNLVHADGGYNLCLKTLRDLNRPVWLVNEHIPFVFEFSKNELDYLESRYRQRGEILKQLFPYDAANYGVDEQWAVCYPYGQEVKKNQLFEVQVRITNHSPMEREFSIVPNLPSGLELVQKPESVRIQAGKLGAIAFQLKPTVAANVGVNVITADVKSAGMYWPDFVEAMVTVQ